jgi:hypothetical protein
MSDLSSTILPQTNNPEEIQRAILDLLSKIKNNQAVKIIKTSTSIVIPDSKDNLIVDVTTSTTEVSITIGNAANNKNREILVVKNLASGAGEVRIVGIINGYTSIYLGLAGQYIDIKAFAAWTKIGGNIQPVALEPPLGWHDIALPDDTLLLNQVAVANTWYPVTFPIGTGAGKIPIGTKKIKCAGQMYIALTAVNAAGFWRPYGTGWTAGNSRRIFWCYGVVTQDVSSVSQIELPVDSAGRVEISSDTTGVAFAIWNAFAYCL